MAADADSTPAQVALAWLAAQRSVAAPIASATSVAHVDELLGAMRLVLTLPYLMTKNIWVSAGAHILNDWLLFGAVMAAGLRA